jgi:hypothetical protein
VSELHQALEVELGPCTAREKVFVAATFVFAAKYAARMAWKGDRYQPACQHTSYRQQEPSAVLGAAGRRALELIRARVRAPWIHAMLPSASR